MAAACQPLVQAFVSQARQQLPALAQGLRAEELQAFLCLMHDLKQPGSTQVEVSLTAAQVHSCRWQLSLAIPCHSLPFLASDLLLGDITPTLTQNYPQPGKKSLSILPLCVMPELAETEQSANHAFACGSETVLGRSLVTAFEAFSSAAQSWHAIDSGPASKVGLMVQDMDCFASLVWLIMRGGPIAREVLAALTSSQVSAAPCLS